jgi:aspartate racemase
MKRMGVLGGISPQATIDFEVRVHRCAQRVIPPRWNSGYPPMVTWYHRQPPVLLGDDARPVLPMQLDPGLLDAAAWLGQVSDFLVIPCNTAHIALPAIRDAAGCPVLSMIDVTLDEVVRRRCRRVGLLGFHGPPPFYRDPLLERGVACEVIDDAVQTPVDLGIRAVMEGRDGRAETKAVRDAVEVLRARGVDAVVLGCTELPLLLGEEREQPDLVNPAALLAEAAVWFAISGTA